MFFSRVGNKPPSLLRLERDAMGSDMPGEGWLPRRSSGPLRGGRNRFHEAAIMIALTVANRQALAAFAAF
jgi:hypothetical protein